ncbi:MAG: hypothetical protein DA443_03745, partial [Bacteroidetes bacterium]
MEIISNRVKNIGIGLFSIIFMVCQLGITNAVNASEAPMLPLPEGEEILTNGNFSDGLTGWSTYLADWAGVSANISEENEEAVITGIAGVSDQTWHVQLNQVFTQEQIDTLITGEVYTITADVWSNVDGRPTRLFFGEDGGSGAAVLIHDFEANSTTQTISQSFLLSSTYGAMKLGFEAGLSTSDLYIDNVSLTLGGTIDEVDAPEVAASAPTEDAADVVSLFSDAYTNVVVDTWRTEWSSAIYEEVEIDGNATKRYTNLSFVGVETTGANLIDASGMDFVHVDIWTPNMDSFRLKLVDWGADDSFAGGDDTEHELTFTDFTQGEWNSLKIPLADFAGLTNRDALAQYIFAGTPDGAGTLYIDNFYFSSGDAPVNTLALPVTFEDTEQDYGLTDFGGNVSAIVEDPTDAANTVAQSTKTAGSQTWAGTTVGEPQGFSEPVPFAADATTMSVRVWSPSAGVPVRLKVEDASNNTITVETEATVTMAEEWETLVFDFSNQAAGTTALDLSKTYNKASIFFNFGTAGADETYYWDDVEFGGEVTEEPGPTEPTAGAPTPTEDAADVISLFSDAYTNVGVDTWRTEWSSATYEEVEIDGNATKKYTNLTYVGVETTGANLIDASGMDFVHVDIWTPNMDSFRLKLVDWGADDSFAGGDDTEHELTFTDFTQGEWNSLKIPLADFAGLTNRDALAQYIFAGTPDGAGTLYIDNFYFSSGDAPVNTLALPVTFEDTEQDYGLTDFGGNVSAIVEDPTDAANTVAQSTKTAGSQTWAGTTVGEPQGF